jgi:hypothetical protein
MYAAIGEGGECLMETSKPLDRLASFAAVVVNVAFFLMAAVGAAVFVSFCWPDHPTTLEVNCGRVQVGMTLAGVEAILGPGERMNAAPQGRDGPVVKGDAVYFWNAPTRYPEAVVIGFTNGVVVDKLYQDRNYS